MKDERQLDDILPVDGTSEFQIELASHDDAVQEDVIDALEAMTPAELEEVDLDQILVDAEHIHEHQERADELQDEAREAVAEGDYEGAKESTQEALDHLHEAETTKAVSGEFPDDPEESWEVIETAQDVDTLDAADWQQSLGEEQLDDAAETASWIGDGVNDEAEADAVDAHLDAADDHFDVADSHASSTLDGDDDHNDAYDYDPYD